MTDKTKELNAKWIASDEGIEAYVVLLEIIGCTDIRIGKDKLPIDCTHPLRGLAITVRFFYPMDLPLVEDAENVLLKQIYDKGIDVHININKHMHIFPDSDTPRIGHMVFWTPSEIGIRKETELITRVKALLAVKAWLDKGGK